MADPAHDTAEIARYGACVDEYVLVPVALRELQLFST